MNLLTLKDVDIGDKRVLIREDLNVPIENGQITSTTRLEAILPTIHYAIKQQARIMIMSHLGRPEEGHVDEQYSLKSVAAALSELLKKPVRFVENWIDQDLTVSPSEVLLLENVRFLVGEKKNDSALAKKMASHCDVFVMDAFATAHRKEASTYGVAEFAKISCAGPLLVQELHALGQIMQDPKQPLLAIVGGSKVSTKLTVLESLLKKVNTLILGGGILNTFIKARGYNIGKSLYEQDLVETAQSILQNLDRQNIAFPFPIDVVTATEFSAHATSQVRKVDDVRNDEMILDIGPETAHSWQAFIAEAQTILWNGPVGVFEWKNFAQGTKAIANAIAKSDAYSVAGGGDTIAAIEKFGVEQNISYISTGGGAFLEYIEGKKLPAVEILEKRYDMVCETE